MNDLDKVKIAINLATSSTFQYASSHGLSVANSAADFGRLQIYFMSRLRENINRQFGGNWYASGGVNFGLGIGYSKNGIGANVQLGLNKNNWGWQSEAQFSVSITGASLPTTLDKSGLTLNWNLDPRLFKWMPNVSAVHEISIDIGGFKLSGELRATQAGQVILLEVSIHKVLVRMVQLIWYSEMLMH